VLGDGWIRASFAALVILGIVGGPVIRPRMRVLQRAAEDPRDDAITTLRAAASASILRASLRARVTFGLAVVYLMIAKPDASDSLIVLSLALIFSIVLAVSKRPASSTLAEEYR
jgi:uncharacterized membrane protein